LARRRRRSASAIAGCGCQILRRCTHQVVSISDDRVERSVIAAYPGGLLGGSAKGANGGAIFGPGQAAHLLSFAAGLGLCRGAAGRPETSRCLLFGGERCDRLPLYPVDLGAEICAALSDLSGARQMRRDDWCTTVDVLPPCLQAQFDKGRRCVVEFKRQPHNVPHCLGCQRSRALADFGWSRYPPNGGEPRERDARLWASRSGHM
jgi:hypothetical protein